MGLCCHLSLFPSSQTTSFLLVHSALYMQAQHGLCDQDALFSPFMDKMAHLNVLLGASVVAAGPQNLACCRPSVSRRCFRSLPLIESREQAIKTEYQLQS